MEKIELGPEQMKIMRVLWRRKRATARDIRRALNESGQTKLINVQVLLKRMVDKGAVAYDRKDRTYIYYPLVSDKNVLQHALDRFVDHVFEGSMNDLVSFIVNNRHVSSEALHEIKKMLDDGETR